MGTKYEDILWSRTVFGIRIKEERVSQQMTQEELGRMTGVDRSYISRIESGRGNVTFDTVLLLTSALGVSISDLLRGIEES